MIKEDILLGGEDEWGNATKGHIPERDGIWMGLILFEFMASLVKLWIFLLMKFIILLENFPLKDMTYM